VDSLSPEARSLLDTTYGQIGSVEEIKNHLLDSAHYSVGCRKLCSQLQHLLVFLGHLVYLIYQARSQILKSSSIAILCFIQFMADGIAWECPWVVSPPVGTWRGHSRFPAFPKAQVLQNTALIG